MQIYKHHMNTNVHIVYLKAPFFGYGFFWGLPWNLIFRPHNIGSAFHLSQSKVVKTSAGVLALWLCSGRGRYIKYLHASQCQKPCRFRGLFSYCQLRPSRKVCLITWVKRVGRGPQKKWKSTLFWSPHGFLNNTGTWLDALVFNWKLIGCPAFNWSWNTNSSYCLSCLKNSSCISWMK